MAKEKTLIDKMIAFTGNEFASVAEDGNSAGDVSGWIDTGSYALNALLSGSIYKGAPQNKIIGAGADSGTGKTYFALGLAKNFLDANPDAIVLYFESEAAITKEMIIKRGIDAKRFGIIPVVTVQEFKNQSLKVVDNYEKESKEDRKPLLMILDSLGMLSTSKEIEDSTAGNDTRDMTRAQVLKATFRVLTLRLGRANIPLFVTNHVYDAIGQGPYAAKVQSGGTGMVYASSTLLSLTKAKEKDSSGAIIGAVITVTATKSRLTKENTKVKCLIRYDGGLDRYYGLIDLAEAAGVFKKVSTRYELPDGRKAFKTQIEKNPEKYFDKDILDAIDKYVQVSFNYGSEEYDIPEPAVVEIDSEVSYNYEQPSIPAISLTENELPSIPVISLT